MTTLNTAPTAIATAVSAEVQMAYAAMKAAKKVLVKAEKVVRNLQSKSGSALSATYEKAVKERIAAKCAYDDSALEFEVAKFGNKVAGRFDLQTLAFRLNTDKLEDFIDAAHEEYAEVDKEIGKQLSTIYGLITIVNVTKLARKVYKLDPQSDHTIALRCAMNTLRKSMTEDRNSNFKNVWHSVFGGTNKKGTIKPVKDVFGVATEGLRDAFLGMELEGESDLVKLDSKGIVIKLGNNVFKRMSIREAQRKAEYINQVVFVRNRVIEDQTVTQVAKSLSALQKLAGLHTSGIALEGLRQNNRYSSVVVVGYKGKTWDKTSVALDPLAVLSEGEDAYTPEQLSLAEAVRKEGFGVCSSPENYGKHGYIQMVNTYNRGANAFMEADGSTYEDLAKMPPRLNKQAWNTGEVQFDNVRTIVIGCMDPQYKDLPKDILAADQEAFNFQVQRALVAGQAIASKEFYKYSGTGRFVTGEESDSSGQKTVVSDPSKTMIKELEHVYKEVGGVNNQFVLAGLNSTKSAKFVYTEGWTLEVFMFEGKKVAMWVKETVEKYKLTFSATSNAFRAVDEKLVGVKAALNSLARSTDELQSETATKLIYANNGKTLEENIHQLLAEGKIEVKGTRVATNSQFNSGLELQYGVDVAKTILTSLVRSNIASSFRQDVVNALDIASKTIDENDIGEVSATKIVTTIADGCAAIGLPLEDVKGKVLHVNIVKAVMDVLASTGKKWVRIRFNADNSVLFPITQDLLDSFESTQRPMYVALQGAAAELFEAFSYPVQTAAENVDEETGIITYGVSFTDATIGYSVEKLTKVRDNQAGKPLNKVPAYGCTQLLVTSAHLRRNETYSAVLSALEEKAGRAFRSTVVCLYFKSPLLWKGSVSTAELVEAIGNADTAAWLEQFGGTKEYNDLMQGTASYISPEKAVKNVNDADGDMNSFLFVPSATVVGSLLDNSSYFVDATNESVAAGAYHYASHWAKELAGLILDTENKKGVHLKSCDFAQSFQEAVIRAAKEKANVAIFTSHQTATLNNRGSYQDGLEVALKRVANHPEFSMFSDWANKLLGNKFALKVASEALWSFNGDVQGSCVNFDAMDQVKSSEGHNVKKLASLLSSGELKFVNFNYAKSTAPEGMELRTIALNVTKGIEQRTLEIYGTMFNPEAHNIAVNQLNHVLPAYTEANAAIVKKMVVFLMVVCGSNVGYVTSTKYDICQQISATAQKVNGRGVALNLETLKDVQAEKGKEMVEVDCVQRTIVTAAIEYVGKVLV